MSSDPAAPRRTGMEVLTGACSELASVAAKLHALRRMPTTSIGTIRSCLHSAVGTAAATIATLADMSSRLWIPGATPASAPALRAAVAEALTQTVASIQELNEIIAQANDSYGDQPRALDPWYRGGREGRVLDGIRSSLLPCADGFDNAAYHLDGALRTAAVQRTRAASTPLHAPAAIGSSPSPPGRR